MFMAREARTPLIVVDLPTMHILRMVIRYHLDVLLTKHMRWLLTVEVLPIWRRVT